MLDVVRHSMPDNVQHLHVQTTFHVWKTRGCQCSFRLLMMGGMLPETCWASHKYGIIKFDTLLHLVGFLFMNCAMVHRPTNIKCINILKYYEKFLISLKISEEFLSCVWQSWVNFSSLPDTSVFLPVNVFLGWGSWCYEYYFRVGGDSTEEGLGNIVVDVWLLFI